MVWAERCGVFDLYIYIITIIMIIIIIIVIISIIISSIYIILHNDIV